MKKRTLALTLATFMAATTLIGCGGTNDKKASSDKIQLRYINWNLATEEERNIERRMIEEYEALNENIDIVIADDVDTKDYGNGLTTAAAGGNLPDVFMLQNIPTALSNEWLLDISEFTENDEDWKKVAEPVKESASHNGKVMAIPAGQFLVGYVVNKDIFEKANVKQPEAGFTFENLEEAIKKTNKPSENIAGLGAELSIVDFYPSIKEENLGWYTFDGEKYNLDNPLFKEGIEKANSLVKGGYVYDALGQEQKDKFNGAHEEEVFLNGQIAIRYDGTWSANNLKNANFDYEFIGLPNNKNVIVNDYMGISKDTKNAKEAYEFAKWMSFSKEGTMKRIDLCSENDLAWGSLPILNDSEVNEKFFAWNDMPGVLEAYENLDNSIVEGVKVVPGYVKSRWETPTGVKIGEKENIIVGDMVWEMVRGTTNPADYLDQVNELANKSYQEAKETIK